MAPHIQTMIEAGRHLLQRKIIHNIVLTVVPFAATFAAMAATVSVLPAFGISTMATSNVAAVTGAAAYVGGLDLVMPIHFGNHNPTQSDEGKSSLLSRVASELFVKEELKVTPKAKTSPYIRRHDRHDYMAARSSNRHAERIRSSHAQLLVQAS